MKDRKGSMCNLDNQKRFHKTQDFRNTLKNAYNLAGRKEGKKRRKFQEKYTKIKISLT